MATRLLRLALGTTLPIALWASLQGGLRAQPSEVFQAHYDLAFKLYHSQRYDEALKEFQAAYALRNQPVLLIHIGTTHRQLGHAKDALAAYESFLKAVPNPSADERERLDRAMAAARELLAEKPLAEKSGAEKAASAEPAQPKPSSSSRRELPPEFVVVSSAPKGFSMLTLAGSRGDDLWLAGDALLHFDGQRWSDGGSAWRHPRDGHALDFQKVWGTARDEVWIVSNGLMKPPALLHYNGEQWFPMQLAESEPIVGVWGRSIADAWALSAPGGLLRFDGTEWVPRSGASSAASLSLAELFARTPTEVWAVGDRGSLLRFDGKQLKKQLGGVSTALVSVWASGPSDVWAGGTKATLCHFDGKSFTSVQVKVADAEIELPIIESIWGSGPGDIWAVGGDWSNRSLSGFILHYDGKSWTQAGAAIPQHLRAIWGSGPREVWAVGDSGAVLHFDGSSWTVPDTSQLPAETSWRGIWGSSARDLWLVGQNGTIAHFDGETWSAQHSRPSEVGGNSTSIWRGGPNDIWAVGQYFHHYDGKTWSAQSRGTNDAIYDLWGSSESGEVWAVGSNGCILHYEKADGRAQWTRVRSGTSQTLTGIWGSGPRDIWAVGQGFDSPVLHWNGSSWAPAAKRPADRNFLQVAGTGPSDIWVRSDDSRLHRFNGSAWSQVPVPKNYSISTMLVKGPQEVWVSGSTTPFKASPVTVMRWNGKSWQTIRTEPVQSISRLLSTEDGEIWGVGSGSSLLRYRPRK